MEQVKKFDIQLREIYKSEILMGKIAVVLFNVVGSMLMLIPFQGMLEQIDRMVALFHIIFFSMGCEFKMSPYMRVREGQKYISIYQKLRYLPVSRGEIRRVRIGYLNHYMCRLSLLEFALQIMVSILCGTCNVWSFAYPAGIMAAVWVINLAACC